jgi:hypothetical protein
LNLIFPGLFVFVVLEDMSVRQHETMMMDQLRKELAEHKAVAENAEKEKPVENATEEEQQRIAAVKKAAKEKITDLEKRLSEMQRRQFMP